MRHRLSQAKDLPKSLCKTALFLAACRPGRCTIRRMQAVPYPVPSSQFLLNAVSKILAYNSALAHLPDMSMLAAVCPRFLEGRLGQVEARAMVLAGERDLTLPSAEEAKRLAQAMPRAFSKVGQRLIGLVGQRLVCQGLMGQMTSLGERWEWCGCMPTLTLSPHSLSASQGRSAQEPNVIAAAGAQSIEYLCESVMHADGCA